MQLSTVDTLLSLNLSPFTTSLYFAGHYRLHFLMNLNLRKSEILLILIIVYSLL